jgi:hypothetical protein
VVTTSTLIRRAIAATGLTTPPNISIALVIPEMMRFGLPRLNRSNATPVNPPPVTLNLHAYQLRARYAAQSELIQIGRDVVHRAGVKAERSIHEA